MANEKRLIDPKKALYLAEHSGLYDFDLSALETLLLDEPCITVDAVPVVHGRWIDDGGLDEDGNGQYRCSSCGVGEKHNPTVTVSYCWNCGAKMDGDGNG